MAIKGAKSTFDTIGFPERKWKETNYTTRYHVYTGPHDRVVVQAETAAEAIQKSGVKNPVKVIRGLSSSEWRLTTIAGGRLVKVEGAAEAERAAAEERRRVSQDGVIRMHALAARMAKGKAQAEAARHAETVTAGEGGIVAAAPAPGTADLPDTLDESYTES